MTRWLEGEYWREEDRGHDTPCWVWHRSLDHGYATKKTHQQQQRMARVFYERFRGAMAADHEPDHLCRVRACVNPDHLEAVTHAENVRRGPGVKLTAAQADEVRRSTGLLREVAAQYGIHHSQVSRIRSGMGVMPGPIVFGATEVRKLCGMDSRRTFQYWRDPARGEDRFPDPCCRINAGTVDVYDPRDVTQWAERTRERRGLVWTKAGLARPTTEEATSGE